MNDAPTRGLRQRLLRPASTLLAGLCAATALAAAPSTTLPDTPVGRVGGELLRHVDGDTPEQVRAWAATVLSPAVGQDDAAEFVDGLVSAVRDGGGVSLADAHVQQGLLVLAVKARRGGQRALFLLAPDPARPDKLGQAHLMPMDDPALYADWPAAAVSPARMKQVVHAALDRLVRSNDFSGCVTVTDGGSTVFDECRGLAERNFSVPIDRRTKFHVGSIGKMFTAVAVAQLVEAGKLSWDTPLRQALPEYADHAAAADITVWQLLHHTAGLGDVLVPEYFAHRERYTAPADFLDLIARQPRVGEPGKEWNYSNAGYLLLGRIVEKVSHERYVDYVRQHVFAPAGMEASGFDTLDEVTPRLAVGYYHGGLFSSDWKADWMKIPFKGDPAGGAYSTNADLLRFARALREGRLVKPATVARMFDGGVPAGPGSYAAGFGDRVSHGRHIRGHAGGIEGTDANLQMVWGTDAAVALTSNQGPGQSWMLAEHIADLLAAGAAAR
jgi:CubicO group peptidase (beta-lactamase class C family)